VVHNNQEGNIQSTTSPLRKGSSTEKREVPSYRHYLADRKTTRRRRTAARPESTGFRPEKEALRVDSPGWRRTILDRVGERAIPAGGGEGQPTRGGGRIVRTTVGGGALCVQ